MLFFNLDLFNAVPLQKDSGTMIRRNLLLSIAAMAIVVPAASGQEDGEKQFRAVCSTTQVADFTREIGGDRWQVDCVLAPGQDPHTYELKPSDSRLVAEADICIQNGWHLEGHDWMLNLAKDANKPLVTCVTGVKALDFDEDGTIVEDPHAWLSPINAAIYVRNITEGLKKIDPDNSGEYDARADYYVTQLRSLHSWIQKEVNSIPRAKRILISHHDAFQYFASTYGFESAAPAGWSTGAEVGAGITPQRRAQVVESISSYKVKAIFVETATNPEVVRQIAKDAGVKVAGALYADSMGPKGSVAENYFGMMRENVIKIVGGLK